MEVEVHVILDTPKTTPTTARVFLEPEKSLNYFRRECSKFFNLDIVTMYLPNGQLVSDTIDLKLAKHVIVSPHFNLQNVQLVQDQKPTTHFSSASSASTDCFELKQTTIEVEVLSHSRAGKTTLIQAFIHESPLREANLVTEAVFKKKLDILSTTVEFAITDTVEQPENDLRRRLKDKHAVLIVCSKEKLIEAWNGETMDPLRVGLLESFERVKSVNQSAFVCLAITKYDLGCEFEGQIGEFLGSLASKLVVFRVSVRDDVLGSDVINPSQLFNVIGENVCRNFLKKHRSSQIKRLREFRVATTPKTGSLMDWFGPLKRLFSCMS